MEKKITFKNNISEEYKNHTIISNLDSLNLFLRFGIFILLII